MTKKLKEQIEAKVIQVYEIGYAHGSNPMRVLLNKPFRLQYNGWGAECDELLALVEKELKKCNSKLAKPKSRSKRTVV